MAKPRRTKHQINQGGVTIKGEGTVTVKGSTIVGRDYVTRVTHDFVRVYHALNESATISPETKTTIEADLKQIENEVNKGEKAKPSFVQERLLNIQNMAPDIAEIVIATLQSPGTGISLAVKKVINKIQAGKAN